LSGVCALLWWRNDFVFNKLKALLLVGYLFGYFLTVQPGMLGAIVSKRLHKL
jgi:hypothetical protein